MKWGLGVAALLALSGGAFAAEADLAGYLSFEARIYPAGAKFPRQHDSAFSPSVAIQPEVRWDLTDEQRITFIPFGRFDAHDDERTHYDVRELNWLYDAGDWDLRIGLGKVFWGVAESRHLVDIINQTDFVESNDEEDKLGQPMVNANIITGIGTFSGFVLPYFRERTFAGPEGRPTLPLRVAEDRATYEDSDEKRNIDFALRWQERLDVIDIGVAHFHGTAREPRLIPTLVPGGPVLVPQYDIIDQSSIDAQATLEAWLLKFEGIVRSGHGDTFFATVAGFEYTLYQVFDSTSDLGLISEYHFDGRDSSAPFTIFNNDVMVGGRLAFNDEDDSSILAGAIFDIEEQTTLMTLEAATRMAEGLKVELEARAFPYVANGTLEASFERDHTIELHLLSYF
jgi:hypothetical protein